MVTKNSSEKQQQVFRNMTPQQLVRYIKAHPLDSLSKGVLNTRFKKSIQTLEKMADTLPNETRTQIATWVTTTFTTQNIIVSPHYLQKAYSQCIWTQSPSQMYKLQSAISDFITFSGSLVTDHIPEYLQEFTRHLSPMNVQSVQITSQTLSSPVNSFAKGMNK